MIPKERPFDYSFLNPSNGVMAGVKVVKTTQLKTVELNPDQLRFAGLPNDGFGQFAIKVVNRDPDSDLTKINANHSVPPDPDFWGQPASDTQPYGIIYSRLGDTVYGNKHPDPQFYLGWRNAENAPRVFESVWSDNKRIVFSFFKLGQ